MPFGDSFDSMLQGIESSLDQVQLPVPGGGRRLLDRFAGMLQDNSEQLA